MQIRAYDTHDETGLWALKARFERELGAIGGGEKSEAYDRKLTDAYRKRYLKWVRRCVDRDPGCIAVCEPDGEPDQPDGSTLVGYVFVLPEELGFVWDAAVVNELFVSEPFRGSGVAEDLMDAALDHARSQTLPLDRVVLDVDPDNERARAFYRKQGFEHWGEMVAREC